MEFWERFFARFNTGRPLSNPFQMRQIPLAPPKKTPRPLEATKPDSEIPVIADKEQKNSPITSQGALDARKVTGETADFEPIADKSSRRDAASAKSILSDAHVDTGIEETPGDSSSKDAPSVRNILLDSPDNSGALMTGAGAEDPSGVDSKLPSHPERSHLEKQRNSAPGDLANRRGSAVLTESPTASNAAATEPSHAVILPHDSSAVPVSTVASTSLSPILNQPSTPSNKPAAILGAPASPQTHFTFEKAPDILETEPGTPILRPSDLSSAISDPIARALADRSVLTAESEVSTLELQRNSGEDLSDPLTRAQKPNRNTVEPVASSIPAPELAPNTPTASAGAASITAALADGTNDSDKPSHSPIPIAEMPSREPATASGPEAPGRSHDQTLALDGSRTIPLGAPKSPWETISGSPMPKGQRVGGRRLENSAQVNPANSAFLGTNRLGRQGQNLANLSAVVGPTRRIPGGIDDPIHDPTRNTVGHGASSIPAPELAPNTPAASAGAPSITAEFADTHGRDDSDERPHSPFPAIELGGLTPTKSGQSTPEVWDPALPSTHREFTFQNQSDNYIEAPHTNTESPVLFTPDTSSAAGAEARPPVPTRTKAIERHREQTATQDAQLRGIAVNMEIAEPPGADARYERALEQIQPSLPLAQLKVAGESPPNVFIPMIVMRPQQGGPALVRQLEEQAEEASRPEIPMFAIPRPQLDGRDLVSQLEAQADAQNPNHSSQNTSSAEGEIQADPARDQNFETLRELMQTRDTQRWRALRDLHSHQAYHNYSELSHKDLAPTHPQNVQRSTSTER